MCKNTKRYYEEYESPFFRLRSQKKLANLLFASLSTVQIMARSDECYSDFETPKAAGGFRTISAPNSHLKSIQRRIADLLQRISPPNYLFSPVAGRSYVDNAAIHKGATAIHTLDIQDFFPNCTANRVIWFFHKRMHCSIDVAAIIRGLVTKDGSLPQGSPCSPILSFLCYVDMWDEIATLVTHANCKMSVYLDDVTVSGLKVPKTLIWDIKKVLTKHGHAHNKQKERSKYLNPVEITGVIVRDEELQAPNRQHRAIHVLRRDLKLGRNSIGGVAHMKQQLCGRESQISQITAQNAP